MAAYGLRDSQAGTLPRPNSSASYGYSSLRKTERRALCKQEPEAPEDLAQRVLDKRLKLLHYIVQRGRDDPGRRESHDTVQLRVTSLGVCVLVYLLELVVTAVLAWHYAHQQQRWCLYLTAGFALLPELFIPPAALVIYSQRPRPPCYVWLAWLPACTPVIGPLLRYTYALGCAGSLRMREEHEDLAQLRLVRSVLGSGPQAVLQLYYLLTQAHDPDGFAVFMQASVCLLSLCAIAWSLTDYYSVLRVRISAGLDVIGVGGLTLLFLWRLLTVGSRILALGFFMSVFTYYTAVPLALHWLLCLAWMLSYRLFAGLRPGWLQPLLYLQLSLTQVLCWLSVLRGRSRMRCAAYYTLWYVENGAMIGLWYLWTYQQSRWYHMPVLAVVLEGCFVGMLFQALFYVYWRDVPCCVALREADIGPAPLRGHVTLPEQRTKLLYSTM